MLHFAQQTHNLNNPKFRGKVNILRNVARAFDRLNEKTTLPASIGKINMFVKVKIKVGLQQWGSCHGESPLETPQNHFQVYRSINDTFCWGARAQNHFQVYRSINDTLCWGARAQYAKSSKSGENVGYYGCRTTRAESHNYSCVLFGDKKCKDLGPKRACLLRTIPYLHLVISEVVEIKKNCGLRGDI